MKYRNLFYSSTYQDSKEFYEGENPKEYKGFKIFHRIISKYTSRNCYDIVLNGVCVGMYVGSPEKTIDEMGERLKENIERSKDF